MEINPALLSPDLKTFEAALSAFHGLVDRSMEDSIAAIDLLDKDQTLGLSEIARRARLVLGQALLSETEAEKLVVAASHWQAAIKHSIQSVLGPEQRQRIYSPKTSAIPSEQKTPLGTPLPTDSRKLNLRGEVVKMVSVTGAKMQSEDDFKSVLLLGSADAHESNVRQLGSNENDFSPIRVSVPSELDSSLGGAICGIIVDGSWWSVIPPDSHESCLRQLLSFSNFIWLKIDQTSLKVEVAKKFDVLCRECRFREPAMSEVGFPMTSRLDHIDIQRLLGAARHLSATDRIRFHPSEITEKEAVVLLGAIQKQQAGKNAFLPFEIERVDTSIVNGGLSSAKIVLLKPNDNSAPFVAKLDDHKLLNDEMLRFRTFIEPWQGQLRPELYIHDGVAVIFFSMIDGAGDQSKPAPTLFERVSSLSALERNENAKNCAAIEDLLHTINRAVERLAILNRKPVGVTTISNKCWIQVEPLIELKRNNIEFSIQEGGKNIDVVSMAEVARQQVQRLNGKAFCHGDIHSRNILVRLDREPMFIDFAFSGPGHPAFDLVRLEASLLYTHFRMAEGEDKMADCFHNIFTTAQSLDEIKKAHPSLLSSKASCVAIHASLETRRAALAVLASYGGNEKDYFGMKLVVACQSLVISGFQEGAVRAGIRAIMRIYSQL